MISVDLDSLLDDLAPEEEFKDVVSGDTLKTSNVKFDNGVRKYSSVTINDLLPKTGVHLGLDLSKDSTGVTLVKEGTYSSFNFSLEDVGDTRFSEILYRRQMYNKLKELYEGYSFDTIVLEDVFAGVNPTTVRLLYAINTAVDELILDGVIECKDFQRVGNGSWKSWLWGIEPQVGKGLDDKERIAELLRYLGVEYSGKGFQDRLDSLGMLVGYFYKHYTLKEDLVPVPKVRWSKVGYTMVEDLDTLVEVPEKYKYLPLVVVDIGMKEITKEYIKYLVGIHGGKLVALKSKRDSTLVKELLKIPEYLTGVLVVWGI